MERANTLEFEPGDWIVKDHNWYDHNAIFEGYHRSNSKKGWVIQVTESNNAPERNLIDLDKWFIHIRPRSQARYVLHKAQDTLSVRHQDYHWITSNSENFCSFCVVNPGASTMKPEISGKGRNGRIIRSFGDCDIVILNDRIAKAVPFITAACCRKINILKLLEFIARNNLGHIENAHTVTGFMWGAWIGMALGPVGMFFGGVAGASIGGVTGKEKEERVHHEKFHQYFKNENGKTTIESVVKNAYRNLGASPGAPWPVIKENYRRMVLAAHPDRHGNHDRFIVLQTSYIFIREYRQCNCLFLFFDWFTNSCIPGLKRILKYLFIFISAFLVAQILFH